MAEFQPKLVDTFHYHLWSDALHLRAISHQARNRWDRGTYVRCTLTNAWTALETACNDALGVTDIGYSFRQNLDHAVGKKALPRLDWSQGLWQEVTQLQGLRKEFLHQGISNGNRFAEASQSDTAIDVCRRAIKAIYGHAGKTAPGWVGDNDDPGFEDGNKTFGFAQTSRQGVDPDHPQTIRIAYVSKDKEYVSDFHPAGTDHAPLLVDLISRIRIPISAVRAYRGNELLEERELLMRGN